MKIRAGIPLTEWISFIYELKFHVTQFPNITSSFTTSNSLIGTSPIVVSTSTSTVTPIMARVPPPPPADPARYAPLVFPTQLHDLPQGYSTRIKTFGGEEGITVEHHVDQFNDFIDLEEVYDEDVKMRLFVQSFISEVRKWFKALTPESIQNWDKLKDKFLRKWGSKVNHVQDLTKYNNLKKASNESVQDFSKRFNKVYNSTPAHIKPPPGVAQLRYVATFDYEFLVLLREREYATLSDMKNHVVKVEFNMVSAKRSKIGKGRVKEE